jgi:hypothetical protein
MMGTTTETAQTAQHERTDEMRTTYGIPYRSRALRSLKKLIVGALLAYALFTLLNLGSTANAAPEPAQPEAAAATATETAPSTPAALPAVDGELVTVIVLTGLLAAYVVVRKVLAPIARGEFPFGTANPGI